MRNLQNHFDSIDKLLMFLGTIAGGTITLLAIEHLSPEQAALVSAILMAILSFVASELSAPRWWWLCNGAIAGMIIGLGSVLSETLADNDHRSRAEHYCYGHCWRIISSYLNCPFCRRLIYKTQSVSAGE